MAVLSLKKKILISIGVGLLALSLGLGFAWLKGPRPWTFFLLRTNIGQNLTFVTDLSEGEKIQISGKAFCGYCYLGLGKGHPSIVLKTEDDKLLPLAVNEKFKELEKITGTCANGTVEIFATGTIVTQEGRKHLLLESFSQKGS